MTVSSEDFIVFAKSCLAHGDEIGFRNAIGRAYYGAYHHVNPLMIKGPKESHQGLINYLKDVSWRDNNEAYEKKYLIALAHTLQALKDQRIRADYDLSLNFVELDASVSVKTAEKLIGKCAEMVASKVS